MSQAHGGPGSLQEPPDFGSQTVGEVLSGFGRMLVTAVRLLCSPVRWVLRQRMKDVGLALGIVAAILAIGSQMITYVGEGGTSSGAPEVQTTGQVHSPGGTPAGGAQPPLAGRRQTR